MSYYINYFIAMKEDNPYVDKIAVDYIKNLKTNCERNVEFHEERLAAVLNGEECKYTSEEIERKRIAYYQSAIEDPFSYKELGAMTTHSKNGWIVYEIEGNRQMPFIKQIVDEMCENTDEDDWQIMEVEESGEETCYGDAWVVSTCRKVYWQDDGGFLGETE